jgi:hypothetical protein
MSPDVPRRGLKKITVSVVRFRLGTRALCISATCDGQSAIARDRPPRKRRISEGDRGVVRVGIFPAHGWPGVGPSATWTHKLSRMPDKIDHMKLGPLGASEMFWGPSRPKKLARPGRPPESGRPTDGVFGVIRRSEPTDNYVLFRRANDAATVLKCYSLVLVFCRFSDVTLRSSMSIQNRP